ncbi:MAG TPA: hypothetical protein VGD74_07780 [Vulgatibacter sp.]
MRSLCAATAATAAVVLLTGCGLASFDVPVKGTIEVPGNPMPEVKWTDEPITLPQSLTAVKLKDSKEFADNGVDPSDVKSIKLRSMKLEALDGETLDFLDTVAFFASAEGKPEIKIAEGKIPEGATKVSLDVESAELKDYALSSAMTISTKVTGTPPASDTKVQTTVVFNIKLF